MKSALLIGATGLVGSHLLDLLLKDDRFGIIKVFARKSTGKKNDKIEEYLVDFDKMGEWARYLTGDVLFSALGTTIRKAGSQSAQYRVDFTYQYDTALNAAENGVSTYVLVSSAGASPGSKVFYSRMKGELEEAVCKLAFNKIRIIRPGILDGNRNESRPMEKFAIGVSRGLAYVPGLRQFRPVHAETVAKAMINACFDEPARIGKYTLEEVFTLSAVDERRST
jgi:uncharacterized protein YbjT (DUF2867 family)